MIAQHGPVALWEPHLVVRGCCVWHASVERVFGAGIWWCRGCVPPCVGAPVCGWCVCGVDLFRHTALLLTLLWSTSFHIAGVWSVGLILSLSLSHPLPPPHPNPVALWCLLWDLPSTAQVPSPTTHTPAHTPLLPQGCHTPDVLCFLAGVCVQCTHRTWLTPVERALNQASPPRCTSTRDPLSPLRPSAGVCLCVVSLPRPHQVCVVSVERPHCPHHLPTVLCAAPCVTS